MVSLNVIDAKVEWSSSLHCKAVWMNLCLFSSYGHYHALLVSVLNLSWDLFDFWFPYSEFLRCLYLAADLLVFPLCLCCVTIFSELLYQKLKGFYLRRGNLVFCLFWYSGCFFPSQWSGFSLLCHQQQRKNEKEILSERYLFTG